LQEALLCIARQTLCDIILCVQLLLALRFPHSSRLNATSCFNIIYCHRPCRHWWRCVCIILLRQGPKGPLPAGQRCCTCRAVTGSCQGCRHSWQGAAAPQSPGSVSSWWVPSSPQETSPSTLPDLAPPGIYATSGSSALLFKTLLAKRFCQCFCCICMGHTLINAAPLD